MTSRTFCVPSWILRSLISLSNPVSGLRSRGGLYVRVAAVFLISFLFPLLKLSALPSVPPGACLYALDPTAADAFQIAGAQSVYTACGVVSESSSSSAFEMEGSETLYLENHTGQGR